MSRATTAAPVTVLVTGGAGYLGRVALAALVQRRDGAGHERRVAHLVAVDVRPVPEHQRVPGVEYRVLDVRDPALAALLREHQVNVVAHLAAVVTPGKASNRALEHSIDVLGTANVVACCVDAGVSKLIVTSSGAAYGYYADNPAWLTEDDALRGNVEFAYADHKRQVEELLARARAEHPALQQLVLRPGTVLGEGTANQITALFDGPVVTGLWGAATPFVFIWDRDVAEVIARGACSDVTGTFNLAGDGAVPMRELAAMMGKPFIALPVPLVRGALAVLRRLGRTSYGPEQVDFLRYRPVLSNRRLKEQFGFTPRMTSREVFAHYCRTRTAASSAATARA